MSEDGLLSAVITVTPASLESAALKQIIALPEMKPKLPRSATYEPRASRNIINRSREAGSATPRRVRMV